MRESSQTLLCSVEGAQLDWVWGKSGDAMLHLGELGNTSGDLFAGECVRCGCGNTKLGLKELWGVCHKWLGEGYLIEN